MQSLFVPPSMDLPMSASHELADGQGFSSSFPQLLGPLQRQLHRPDPSGCALASHSPPAPKYCEPSKIITISDAFLTLLILYGVCGFPVAGSLLVLKPGRM